MQPATDDALIGLCQLGLEALAERFRTIVPWGGGNDEWGVNRTRLNDPVARPHSVLAAVPLRNRRGALSGVRPRTYWTCS